MGKVSSARQTILYLLSFQGYLSILGAVRLPQRHHKNRWDQMHLKPLETERQEAHLQIQYWSEVTNWPQGFLGIFEK